MKQNLSEMTPQQIIEGVKNGTIKSESFDSFVEYIKWASIRDPRIPRIEFVHDGSIPIYVQQDENGKSVYATSDESQVTAPYAVTFLKDPSPEYLKNN